MSDKEFLNWLFDRLHHVHGDSPNVDYMHRFRSIIDEFPGELMPDEELDRLMTLSDAGTSGEWFIEGGEIKDPLHNLVLGLVDTPRTWNDYHLVFKDEDIDLTVAAVNALPELVAEVRKLRWALGAKWEEGLQQPEEES